jgi:hypothetical protein
LRARACWNPGARPLFSVRGTEQREQETRGEGHSRGQMPLGDDEDRTCIERPPIEPRRLWAPVRRRRGADARGEKAEAVQISMAAGRSARKMLQAAILRVCSESKEILLFYTPFSAASWAMSSLLALIRDLSGSPRFLESASNPECPPPKHTNTQQTPCRRLLGEAVSPPWLDLFALNIT